ncbi:type II toxin-antitoxin system ParD family antitoxin [Planctomicrobium piriforme]|uniref:Antitoxin ParD1/3/4 n=1 Tax=Planctomicrobium piriforme TaxID=1576369 RepID=A0A1I3LTH9_9PLAN|nr:type II toxin-antitoxin system ParD family antitoxin [Planctomicrobium piriforme]SFI87993.1 antitoxin ParD1/3/4 [Planctomicrobium piriforme]
MPTRNVNLTEHYDQFISEQVEAGKFQNASEVLRAGLRLLEQQSQTEEQQLALLKKLAREGFAALDQGAGLAISTSKDLEKTTARIGKRAAKRVSKP